MHARAIPVLDLPCIVSMHVRPSSHIFVAENEAKILHLTGSVPLAQGILALLLFCPSPGAPTLENISFRGTPLRLRHGILGVPTAHPRHGSSTSPLEDQLNNQISRVKGSILGSPRLRGGQSEGTVIRKPDVDKRQYRHVKLENGLGECLNCALIPCARTQHAHTSISRPRSSYNDLCSPSLPPNSALLELTLDFTPCTFYL